MFTACPDAPGHPSIMDIDESAVTLSWTKPRNDGGKKIVGYVVEYKDPTTGRWKEANDYPCDECVYQGTCNIYQLSDVDILLVATCCIMGIFWFKSYTNFWYLYYMCMYLFT
jgi:hypothetical protein